MRQLIALSWLALVGVAVAIESLKVLQIGTALGAAGIVLGYGVVVKNQVWILAGLYLSVIGFNVMWWWRMGAASTWRIGTDGSVVVAVLLSAAAVWLGARPYISSPTFRRRGRFAVTGAFLMLPSGLIFDAQTSSNTNSAVVTGLAVALGAVGFALLACAGISMARLLDSLQRRSDAIVICGIVAYAALHIPGMAFGSDTTVLVALIVVSLAFVTAVTAPGARKVGTSLDPSRPLIPLSLWPVILGAVAMGFGHASLRIDLIDGTLRLPTVAMVALAIVAMLFAAREIGGPRKPLVLPFGRRDRALQRLPAALLNGDVRLVGQPVWRAIDSKVVGIEARPDWSARRAPHGSIEEIAAVAGMEQILDSITLRLAQDQLTDVLQLLDGDEPWLSVPLTANTEAAGKLPDHGEIDGLVLRVPNADVAQAIDALRDHGALLQTPADVATDLDPEIVDGRPPTRRSAAVSLHLARASEIAPFHGSTEINLVVDDSLPPTNLDAILRRYA